MNNDQKNALLDILNSVQEHIRLQDTKAVGLLTAIGIVFSFSLFSLDNILSIDSSYIKIIIYICGLIYLISFLISIVLLIVALFPMRKKKSNNRFFPKYAIDVYKMTKSSNFSDKILRDINNDDILDQIKICSKIAFVKENCIRISTFSIVSSVFLLSIIIVLIIIG